MGKSILGICLFLLTVFAVGCTPAATSSSDEPPNAVVEVEQKQIQLIRGSYQWKNAIADAPSPDNLVKDTTDYIVKPNAEITINFKGEKPEKFSAGLWKNQNFVELPTKGDAFVLPSQPGVYVLTILGEWSGNDRGTYAAAVEVQE